MKHVHKRRRRLKLEPASRLTGQRGRGEDGEARMPVSPRVMGTSFAQPHYARHCSIRVTRYLGRCGGVLVCIHIGCATMVQLFDKPHRQPIGGKARRRPGGCMADWHKGSVRLLEECSLQVQPRHQHEGPETVDSHQAITSAAQSGQSHHTLGYRSRHAPSPTNLAVSCLHPIVICALPMNACAGRC
jgi:hypothetical protein